MRIFIQRPIATSMIYLAVFALGLCSFFNLPLELAPTKDFPQLDIRVIWPNVPPQAVLTQVTTVIEGAASMVKGVKKITSRSSLGLSTISVEFARKTNMEFACLALREEISLLEDKLPCGVQPQVLPYVPTDFRADTFLSYSISGDSTLQKLRHLVKEKIESGIGSVRGVALAEVTGGSDPGIQIVLDREKLQALRIDPSLVNDKIIQRLRPYPSGKIRRGNQELSLKISEPILRMAELGEIVISYAGRNTVKLNDVGKVVPAEADIFSISRINGRPTVMLTVQKEAGMNTLKVARDVKKRLESIRKELPPDVTFSAVEDESEVIQRNLKNILLLMVTILLVIFLLLFLALKSFRPCLLVLSSVVFSILITFNLIFLFRISMNLLTLGVLTLGFGLFVDNSIVVLENILRLRERGVEPRTAALEGAKEVFLPVLAATLTTVSVFFSFAFFQGRLKATYLPLAIVISSALASSLFVSFSLIPALSPSLLIVSKKTGAGRIQGFYERALRRLLQHPLEVILVIAALFFGTYKWFRAEVNMGEFFQWSPKESLAIYMKMPPGTDIEETDALVRKFEKKVLDAPYEKELNTLIQAENARISVSFPPDIENSTRPYALKDDLIQLATQFAGIGISIYGFDLQGYYSSTGTGTYGNSSINFYGYNFKKLSDITSALGRNLKRNPRVKDVRIVSDRYGEWRIDSFESILKIDREALGKYKIDPRDLTSRLQTLVSGRFGVPMRAKIGGSEGFLTLAFPESDALDLQELQETLIQIKEGESLKLGDVILFEEKPIAGSIDRENQQFLQKVIWEFKGPFKEEEKFRKTIFESLQLTPGFSASLEESWEMMTEGEKAQIRFAFVSAFVIIFMILASLYESFIQPFFIIMAVPLSLIGVFVAFVVARWPFDSSAHVGVMLLGGIVVNNAILLVDNINQKRKHGFSLLESIIKGAQERIRPIFMTTSTTVLGLMPLLLIQAEVGKRQIWSILALCTLGGLASSTVLILIVIPLFYYHGDKGRQWSLQKLRKFKTVPSLISKR